jgi:hypothetical protein
MVSWDSQKGQVDLWGSVQDLGRNFAPIMQRDPRAPALDNMVVGQDHTVFAPDDPGAYPLFAVGYHHHAAFHPLDQIVQGVGDRISGWNGLLTDHYRVFSYSKYITTYIP